MYGHDAENLVHPHIQSTTILCDINNNNPHNKLQKKILLNMHDCM